MCARPFDFGFNFGVFAKQAVGPGVDPRAALNAERVKQVKAMAQKVQNASGVPNAVGNGQHNWSGVVRNGQVANAQYSGPAAGQASAVASPRATTPRQLPEPATAINPNDYPAGRDAVLGNRVGDPSVTNNAIGRLVGGAENVRRGYDRADAAMGNLLGNNAGAGNDDSLVLPNQAPSQPRPMVPNITRPARVPSFTPNTDSVAPAAATPAAASAPVTPQPAPPASTPPAAATPPAAPPTSPPAAAPQLTEREINRAAFQARSAERANAQARARAAGNTPGSGRIPSRSQPSAAPTVAPASAPTPSAPVPSPGEYGNALGAAAAAAAASGGMGASSAGAAAAAAAGQQSQTQSGPTRANGTQRPRFGQRTPTPATRPNMGSRYGVNPLQATADYRAANTSTP